MNRNVVKVPWGSWYMDIEKELVVPEEWQVQVLSMQGPFNLTDSDIERAFANPIGTERIAKLAAGKKKVVIATDDHTRPTPTGKLLRQYVFKELDEAGIKREDIMVIMAFGAHRAMSRHELKLKLGEDIVDSVAVYNHNPYENLVHLGTSSKGSPIDINRDFVEADLRIGIGLIVQHPIAGFGGGGKIVQPGVSGIDTLEKTHTPAADGRIGAIINVENKFREEIEEIAKKAGLDIIINVLARSNTEYAGVFVGDFIKAHRQGVELAKKVYATPLEAGFEADLAICNQYPFDTDVIQNIRALNPFAMGDVKIVRDGGTIVITAAALEGASFHFMSSRGGRLFRTLDNFSHVGKILAGRKVHVFSPNLSPVDVRDYFPQATLFKRWEDVVARIKADYGAKPLKTVVFPYAPMQIVQEVKQEQMPETVAAAGQQV